MDDCTGNPQVKRQVFPAMDKDDGDKDQTDGKSREEGNFYRMVDFCHDIFRESENFQAVDHAESSEEGDG